MEQTIKIPITMTFRKIDGKYVPIEREMAEVPVNTLAGMFVNEFKKQKRGEKFAIK